MQARLSIFFLTALMLFMLVSCEKEITIDLPQAERKIVVEGTIAHSVHGLQGQVLNAVLHKAAIAAGITCSRAGAQPPRAHELVEAMEK